MAKGDIKKQEDAAMMNTLSDENWNAFIFVIYLDAGTADTNATKLASLGDRISSGLRQRFTTVSRSEIIAWAIDNIKTNDACKDLKAALDSGTSEANLTDSIIAKVVKAWLYAQKEEGVDAKNGKYKEITGTEVDEKGKPKASKETGSSANKKAQANGASAKGAKADTSSSGSAGSDSKRKSKLRERTGGPQKDRVTAIGDEPVDGPDCYYFFRDLNTLPFLTAFNEEVGLSVDAIFRGVYDPSEAIGKKGEKEKSEEQMVNSVWSSLKSRAKQNLAESWRRTAWENLKNANFIDSKDAFEILSARIYKLLDKRKIYESFFKYDQIYKIPSFERENVDLRYYEYLTSMANSGGVTNVEFILALLLENIGRANALEENSEPNEYIIGSLKQLLDSELNRVGFDSNSGDQEKIQSMVTIEVLDKTRLQSYFMKSLESINLNPLELIGKIQKAYRSNKYANFTEQISEFKKMKPSQIQAESLKLMTEFLKNTSFKELDVTLVERILIQIELEYFCKQLPIIEGSDFSLRNWKWFGAMSSSSILQAIEATKITRPEIHYSFAPLPGKLLVMLKSPGPIGCLEYKTSTSKRIRSKVGFSKFNDLYNFTTNSLEGEKPSYEPGTASYDVKDRALSIQQEFSYLYPANNVIITVVKRSISDAAKDISTKVNFGETALQVSGISQSKKQIAYLTSSFGDGSVFSISSKEGSLSIQFCDVSGRHYSFEKDGSIICQFYSKTPSSNNGKNKEVKRVYLPTGVVIKYFESKAIQVLFPDGSYASKLPAKDWIKVSRNEPFQKVSIESNEQTGEIHIGWEDFVSISKKENSITVEHSCLTLIETQLLKSYQITAPDSAAILFKASGEQEITISKYFKVERKFKNGETSSIKVIRNDMTIDATPSGNAVVKLSREGYSKPIASDQNVIEVNWILGTINFKDILDYEFMVKEDGSTAVKTPAYSALIPEYSFGGHLLRDALKSDSPDSMVGNVPVFFAISPDGQSSYHLQRDVDQLLYYQSNRHQYSRNLEENDIIPGAITCCSTKKFKADLVESQLVEYSQFTRYKPTSKVEYSLFAQEYEDLLTRYRVRNEVVANEKLGETLESKLEQTKNKFPFVYGMNKEATQLAILLKHLQEEELANDPGLNVTKDMRKLLKNVVSVTGKSTTPSTAEKHRHYKKRTGSYKVPKYFESPEGKSFAVANPVSKPVTTNMIVAPEQSIIQEKIELYNEESVMEVSKAASEEKKSLETQEASVIESPVAVLIQTPNPSQIASGAVTEVIVPIKSKEPKIKVKKERKLQLPASILGAKPGVIPNSIYIDREAAVRRHVNTVSTAQPRKQNNNYGSAEFMVRPALVEFGNIDVNSDLKNSVSVIMTNIGLDSGRFKIKQQENTVVDIEYKHGLVAPGMAVIFTFKLKKGIDLKANNQIDEEIKIISEMEILYIPVKGTLMESKKE